MFQWLSTLILALRGPLKTPEVSMGNRTRIGWLRLEGSEESSFVVMRNSPSVRMWHHQIELLSPCNNQISFPSKFLLMCTKLLVNYTPILLFHGQHGVNKEWTTPLCAVHKTYSFPSFFLNLEWHPGGKRIFFNVVFHLFLLPFEFTTFLSLGRPSLPGNSFRPLFLFVCCLKFRPVNAKLSWHQMQAMLIQVSDRYFSPWRQNTSHLLWHTISLIEVMSFKNIRLIKTRRQQKKFFV